jgi:hypothetical protein
MYDSGCTCDKGEVFDSHVVDSYHESETSEKPPWEKDESQDPTNADG